jgi:hypothetical protein
MTEISLIVERKHGKVKYMLLFLIDLVLALQISLLNTRSLQITSRQRDRQLALLDSVYEIVLNNSDNL